MKVVILNLNKGAVRNLEMGNEMIACNGRFGVAPFDLMVPVAAVICIFAKETGQGLVFQGGDPRQPPPAAGGDSEPHKPKVQKPNLKIVK